MKQHVKKVIAILNALKADNLIANPKKTNLFAYSMTLLGHIISENKIEADPVKIKKVLVWPVPTSKERGEELMAYVNWLRKFIPQLSQYAVILKQLTSKEVRLDWKPVHQRAFEHIQKIVGKIGILAQLNYKSGEPIWLITDTSNTGTRGYLAQSPTWKDAKAIEFESRTYNSAQKSYATMNKNSLPSCSASKIGKTCVYSQNSTSAPTTKA